MANTRLRIPFDPDYISALGLCVYAFSRLEWDAVWCCERIQANSISALAQETAGGIARKLIALTKTLPPSLERDKLLKSAEEFKALTETRNAILHSNPGTDKDGAQRLFRNGQPWLISALNDAADAFTACSIVLNSYLHGFLTQKK